MWTRDFAERDIVKASPGTLYYSDTTLQDNFAVRRRDHSRPLWTDGVENQEAKEEGR